jgi:CRP/FNR family cyclic AMP-dependent transcriptional regulator
MRSKRQWIETNPLFENCRSEILDEICQNLHAREVRARTMFVMEEQSSRVVSIIVSGTVRISLVSGSRELILNLIGAGEVLGEINLLDGQGHSADVMATEDTQLYWISSDILHGFMLREPQLGINLAKILSRRLRLATARIQALGGLDVPGRVAFQILAFATEYGIETPQGIRIPLALTQGEIADLIGATRTRVNQAIAKMKAAGVLVEENAFYTVVDAGEMKQKFVQFS